MLKSLAKPRRGIRIGPADDGKPMSLKNFDRAIAQEGYIYELARGIIQVSDVPHPSHLSQVQEIRDQLTLHRLHHPGTIHTVAGSGESKILVESDQSERHPDISVYFSGAPDGPDVWSKWIPTVVAEVVSKSSGKRDYEEKVDEYLVFGVDEYWIIDSFTQLMTVHARWRGQWQIKVVKANQKYNPPCLRGFSLDLKRVFAAAK